MKAHIQWFRGPVVATALALLVAGSVSAKEVHVSPGNVDASLSNIEAGDTVWLAEARYTTPIILQGLEGTASKPITVAAAPGARVVFDGTDELPND